MVGSEADAFVKRAEAVLRRIEIYAQSNQQEIPPQDLDLARREIEAMVASVRGGATARNHGRARNLSRLIVDQWPLGHSLGNAISEIEAEYGRLFE